MNDKSKSEDKAAPKSDGSAPAKTEPVKAAPAKPAQAKTEPVKAAPAKTAKAPVAAKPVARTAGSAAAKPAAASPAKQPTVKARRPLSKAEYARTTQQSADSTAVIPAITDDAVEPATEKPKSSSAKPANTAAEKAPPTTATKPAAVAAPPSGKAAPGLKPVDPKPAVTRPEPTEPKAKKSDPLADTATHQAIEDHADSPAKAEKETAVIPAVAAPGNDVGQDSDKARRRKVRRKLSYIEPWSVTKMTFLISVAMMIVLLVAVVVFWFVLQVTGVWNALNDSIVNVLSDGSADFDVNDYVGLARVSGLALIVSAFNVVFFTALATIAAHLYNLAAGVMGGVEVTFEERDR